MAQDILFWMFIGWLLFGPVLLFLLMALLSEKKGDKMATPKRCKHCGQPVKTSIPGYLFWHKVRRNGKTWTCSGSNTKDTEEIE